MSSQSKKAKENRTTDTGCGSSFETGFSGESSLQKLVTDITYLPYGGKMLYLSSTMDLYNGEIIAYNIGDKQDTTKPPLLQIINS
ncbi:hypothetical protein [Brevibacillus halotolerans]|uniref:hypothetical protein n=1 Tax=Brevibacillus halotolerans TaxID=1507437 RepID=UPI001FE82F41|nr:hypothetical protein [Brevibacillus halotolerans]